MRMTEPRAIDVHHHYAPPAYRAVAAAYATRDPEFAKLNDNVAPGDDASPLVRLDLRLAEMDEAGIDVAVLSVNPPAPTPVDPARAAELFARSNDGLLEACAAHPGRFLMLAALPLPHVPGALAELDRLAGREGVRGICVGAGSFSYEPDRPEWAPVLERVAALGLPLLLHPSLADAARAADPLAAAFGAYSLTSAVRATVATSVAALRLVFSGALDRHPGLDVIVPHLGGVIPYLAQRIVDQGHGSQRHELDHYLRARFFYDDCSYHGPAFRCAVDTVGADRIMLGSDYPFRGALERCVSAVRDAALTPELERAVLAGTAARWFAPASGPTAG